MSEPTLKPSRFTFAYIWYEPGSVRYEANGMQCGCGSVSGILSIDRMFLDGLKKGSGCFAELMERESALGPDSPIKRLSFSVYRRWYSIRPCYTLTFEACPGGFKAKVNGRSYGKVCEQEPLTFSYALDTFLMEEHQFNMGFIRRTMVEQGRIDLGGTARRIVIHAE